MSPALAAASAALGESSEHRDSRSRLCFLLADLGSKLDAGCGELCVSRSELAQATGISLTRVKRILAFLDLSGIIEQSSAGIRVTEWQRLCRLGRHDCAWLGLPASDSEDDERLRNARPRPSSPALTATLAGDPASFV